MCTQLSVFAEHVALIEALRCDEEWVVEGPGKHPEVGDCMVCELTLGKGRKQCPQENCGHIVSGGNTPICPHCDFKFVPNAPKKKKRPFVVDSSVTLICPASVHPSTGGCSLCKLSLGKGKKQCPNPQCGHVISGANSPTCTYCKYSFRNAAEVSGAKKRRVTKPETSDAGTQWNPADFEGSLSDKDFADGVAYIFVG